MKNIINRLKDIIRSGDKNVLVSIITGIVFALLGLIQLTFVIITPLARSLDHIFLILVDFVITAVCFVYALRKARVEGSSQASEGRPVRRANPSPDSSENRPVRRANPSPDSSENRPVRRANPYPDSSEGRPVRRANPSQSAAGRRFPANSSRNRQSAAPSHSAQSSGIDGRNTHK